jgi:hypothetical protein
VPVRSITSGTILCLAAVLIAGCSGSQSQDQNPGDGSDNHMRNVTDTRSCAGNPGQSASIFNTWRMEWASDQFNMTTTFQINTGATTVTNLCYFPSGIQVSASTTVASVVQNNAYSIYTSGQDTESKLDAQGAKFSCTVSVQPQNMMFGLVGNCLKLTDANQVSSYLVP